jgi:hypothetical protein
MADNWLDSALDSVARNMTAAGFTPVGYRPNGRPIWPMMGGAPDDGDTGGDAGAGSDAGAGDQGAGQGGNTGDRGFPENTPWSEMTPEQQVNYWRYQSRRHEDRARVFADLTPEALRDLRDKAARAEQLEYDLGTDKDRAVTDARKAEREAVIAEVTPEVVAAKLDAAAARAGVSETALAAALEFVDAKRFLKDDGKIDADRVTKFVASIAPDRGNNAGRRGPSGAGTGRQPSHSGGLSAAERGRAEAQKRFGTTKTTA